MKFYNYVILAASLCVIACNDKRSEIKLGENRIIGPQIYKSKIFNSYPLQRTKRKSSIKVYMKELYVDGGGLKYKLEKDIDIEELKFSNAKVYIYSRSVKNDTLEVYKDSVRFNSTTVDKLATQEFNINEIVYTVYRYRYMTHAGSTGIARDLYIIPSVGIILEGVVSQRSAAVEYNVVPESLHKKIEQDSTFFDL